jgi:hypothetical protein
MPKYKEGWPMRRGKRGATKRVVVVGLILTAIAAGICWQWKPITAWYALSHLAGATDVDREPYADRVAEFGFDVVPGLVGMLNAEDPKLCVNAAAGLGALRKRWGPAEPQTATLAEQLTAEFVGLSQPGREAVVEWHLELLRELDLKTADARRAVAAANRLLTAAVDAPASGLRLRALVLAEVLLGRGNPTNTDTFQQLAVNGMGETSAALRAQAIRLAMHPPLSGDKALLDRVLPLLRDAAPEVRRAAVLAVGLAEETISVQDLLPLLQDPDGEVRRLCEVALRGRGLQDSHIELARLFTDNRPGQRLRVVNHLLEIEDLDVSAWLTHLSQDPSPAVRAGALRVAAFRFAHDDPAAGDFLPRMRQMAMDDPNPTVRQLAGYYWNLHQHQ